MEFLAELHPKMVHFPIVLFILYFILETISALFKKEELNKFAFYILVAGVVFGLIGVATGNQAFSAASKSVSTNNELIVLIGQHEELATITLWYFVLTLVFRTYLMLKKKFNSRWKSAFSLLSFVGCYLVIKSALLGGELVYKYGVGTRLFNDIK